MCPNRAKCVGMGQTPKRRDRPEGIVPRHQQRCASRAGTPCDCKPAYQAQVWSPRDGKPIRKTFRTIADARAWRAEAKVALRGGTMRAPTRTTLEEAADQWLVACGVRKHDRALQSAFALPAGSALGALLTALTVGVAAGSAAGLVPAPGKKTATPSGACSRRWVRH